MSKVVIKVDEFVRETNGSWHCQFADLENPTYIPKELRGEEFDQVGPREFECPKWLAKKTATALGVDLEDLVA